MSESLRAAFDKLIRTALGGLLVARAPPENAAKTTTARAIKTPRSKPIVCSVCAKSFVYQKCFEKHVSVHAKQKPPPNAGPVVVGLDAPAEGNAGGDVSSERDDEIAETSPPPPSLPSVAVDENKRGAGEGAGKGVGKGAVKRRPAKNGAPAKKRARKSLVCTMCGDKSFVHQRHLDSHLWMHLETYTPTVHDVDDDAATALGRPFGCTRCDESFVYRFHLEVHMRMHLKDDQYRCNDCNAVFLNFNQLRIHSRMHTGEKPYRCKSCGKTFTSWLTGKSHAKSAHGKRP